MRALFNSYAGIRRLDAERFKKDMDSERTITQVTADQKQGASLGVRNTPAILVNNRSVDLRSRGPDTIGAAVQEVAHSTHK